MKRLVIQSVVDLNSWMEEQDLQFTHDPADAIFLTKDGKLISGKSRYNQERIRDVDHRVLEYLVDISRYSRNFWKDAIDVSGFVMLVPENKQIMLALDQVLTDKQKSVLNQKFADYEIIEM